MKLSLTTILVLMTISIVEGQFTSVQVSGPKENEYRIVQIDQQDASTLLHFEYSNLESFWLCVDETIFLFDKSANKKYRLLNSINAPICDKKHLIESAGEGHYFTLEFEKTQGSSMQFEIRGSSLNGMGLLQVTVDTTIKANSFLSVNDFIERTPLKEFGVIYKDGSPVYYYQYKGVRIAVLLDYDNNYGEYYQASIVVTNLSGKDLIIEPDLMTARVQKGLKIYHHKILTYQEYISKVKKRQNWESFAVALGESLAANRAGYSEHVSISQSRFQSNTTGSAVGYVNNRYGSVYYNGSTVGTVYSTSYLKSYDGSNAYFARQNANQNIANFQDSQFQVLQNISQGYLRMNTIPHGTEFYGYVNLPYVKVDGLVLVVPFYKQDFIFSW